MATIEGLNAEDIVIPDEVILNDHYEGPTVVEISIKIPIVASCTHYAISEFISIWNKYMSEVYASKKFQDEDYFFAASLTYIGNEYVLKIDDDDRPPGDPVYRRTLNMVEYIEALRVLLLTEERARCLKEKLSS